MSTLLGTLVAVRRVLLAVALSALVAVATAAARPPAARSYLDHALGLMRSEAVVTPTEGWPSLMRNAHRMAAKARTDAQTYGAIISATEALYQAGDVHARFTNPFMAKLAAQAAKSTGTTSTPPSIAPLEGGKVRLLTLPAIGSAPNTPNARRYETAALTAISAAEAAHAPCGWIIDLRQNTGGDMYPMLLGIGPILGEGNVIGFRSRTGFDGYVSYNDGVLSVGKEKFAAPRVVPDLTPAPPVALLTGGSTLSSGEAVLVAFHGRAGVRSFGAPTGGAPTSPRTYRLSDGATVSFSVADDVDRTGAAYIGPITPDQPVASVPQSDTISAAEQWLLATPSCTAG